jgi:hypothetical protein
MPPIELTPELLVAAGVALVLFLALVVVGLQARALRKKLGRILSIEAEVARLQTETTRLVDQRQQAQVDADHAEEALQQRKAALDASFATARAANDQRVADLGRVLDEARTKLEQVRAELTAVEEDLHLTDLGVYRPHFDLGDSAAYQRALDACRQDVKLAIKQESAIIMHRSWTVEGSTSKGERMQRQLSTLMLRAFNGECDAAIARVAWNNVTRMESRIEKAFAAINRLGTVVQIELNVYYLGLRLKELRLVHEHETKKREEAEEQRRIREQMREEEKVQRELERARREAEAEERKFTQALEQARAEAKKASGEAMLELNDRIRQLEQSLAEAHARGERAISQAQLTRSGHVYIVSNIGSFGEDVFKIGMTRRLEPLERVKELGDASVPFEFDVHAMIYSDDAPALETALHRKFGDTRLNLVNDRKEFFRVELASIAEFAKSLGLEAELTLLAEAREYRETLAIRAQSSPAAAASA